MSEQSTTPQKSADDVKPSTARTAAERDGAKSTKKGEPRNPVIHQEGPHPMTGKSMSYSTGPGAESYTEGQYESDKVNSLGHFNR